MPRCDRLFPAVAFVLFCACGPEDTGFSQSAVIETVTISARKADDGLPLVDADVVLYGESNSVTGTTNSCGVAAFHQVQADNRNMHCLVQGFDGNTFYYWYSYEDGYPSGIDFYEHPSMTITISPANP